MISDLRLWNRLYCVAFDDVMRDLWDIDAVAGPEHAAEMRAMATDLLRSLSEAGTAPGEPWLPRPFDRLLRATLFLRFGERVLHWLDRLAEVDGEYRRRVDMLRGAHLSAEDLRRHLDRPDA